MRDFLLYDIDVFVLGSQLQEGVLLELLGHGKRLLLVVSGVLDFFERCGEDLDDFLAVVDAVRRVPGAAHAGVGHSIHDLGSLFFPGAQDGRVYGAGKIFLRDRVVILKGTIVVGSGDRW